MKLSVAEGFGHESRHEAQRAEQRMGLGPLQGWGSGGVTPGKILKFETQFGAVWCILARN